MRLKHKITLLENRDGELEEQWQNLCEVYAEVNSLYDSRLVTLENVEFGSIVSAEYYIFKIRFKENINTNLRISFHNQIFEIKRVINENFTNKFLTLIALQI